MRAQNQLPTLENYLKGKKSASSLLVKQMINSSLVIYVNQDEKAPTLIVWKGMSYIKVSMENNPNLSKLISIFKNVAEVKQTENMGYIKDVVKIFSESLKAIDLIFNGQDNKKKMLFENIKTCLDGLVKFILENLDDPLALKVFLALQENINERLGITPAMN